MKPVHYLLVLLATTTLAAVSLPATYAQTTETQAPGGDTMVDGEIRRVDKETKKLTIRHGAIRNLDMPPMTMVFQVKDPSMLGKVNPGDKVRFSAEKIGGVYTVTAIELAR